MAQALADAMQRWDDEGDDDTSYQEAYEEDWSLSEFIALVLVRDGWTFEKRQSDGTEASTYSMRKPKCPQCGRPIPIKTRPWTCQCGTQIDGGIADAP